MNHSGISLDDFFDQAVERGLPLVLATIVETIGSTYRKAGAQMLAAADGSAAGLLSGGCLEADLMDHARSVFERGQAKFVEYDARGTDDLIWGIGLGCEGAMKILLSRLDPSNDYEPFRTISAGRRAEQKNAVAVTIESNTLNARIGTWFIDRTGAPTAIQGALAQPPAQPLIIKDDSVAYFVIPIQLPRRILVLGAGPDAIPLVQMASMLGWHVTITDHRPAYARPAKFPHAREVHQRPAADLSQLLRDRFFDAAVVMSHHLVSDELYLRQLAESAIAYVGLLGPAPRRARLLAQLGERASLLTGRLHGPIGLDLGADSPETIALAIVSEIQAVLAGRSGMSFSRTTK
jgi:xanthine/CO dehydrogenase XdhC/CoxF family maturation factor